MEKIEIPIVMAANSAYLPYAAVSICSMSDTKGSKSKYKIHILHTDLKRTVAEHLLSLAGPDVIISFCNVERFLAPYINHLYAERTFQKKCTFVGELVSCFLNMTKRSI